MPLRTPQLHLQLLLQPIIAVNDYSTSPHNNCSTLIKQ
ncbi:hypothetical protein VPHK469_0230 [Vibrio phage K469]